ncbi:winged helix-turn-helix transcriptional regulator [Parvimonas micra]|uniref:winged helix-turn-helix transcriptional regulator n=1 Tax=Parvimonas TaxID=543311 RepID=UPI0025F0FB1D|nr:winged helix-turn-helix transcriptional regulator [Parvimonas sp.]
MNKTEKKVIEILIENPSVTSVELAEIIGVTKRTIERTFKSLQGKKDDRKNWLKERWKLDCG